MTSTTNAISTVWTARDELSATMARMQKNTSALDRAFGSLWARFKTGFVVGAGQAFFNFMDQGIHRLLGVIPDLIGKGETWAKTVEEISLASRMSAQDSSVLAGIWQDLTGTADGLSNMVAMANKNLTVNHKSLSRYGITATNVAGALEQLRQRYQSSGATTTFAAHAQQLLGRSWRDALPFLSQTDEGVRQLSADVYASGRVIDETTLRNETIWNRSWNKIAGTWTGIGAQLLASIAPTLAPIVDAWTRFIQDHLQQIVQFLDQVITAVSSFVSTIFGISSAIDPAVGSIGNLGDAAGSTTTRLDQINGQIARLQKNAGAARSSIDPVTEALRRQLDTLNKSEQAQQQRQQLQQTLHDLAQAKRDLLATQQAAYMSSDMSRVALELAKQQHAADVKAAADRVRQADLVVQRQRQQMALAQERNRIEAEIAKREQAVAAATISSTTALQKLLRERQKLLHAPGTKPGTASPIQTLTDSLKAALADSTAFGKSIANGLMDALFGKQSFSRGRTDNGGFTETSLGRTGGLIDTIAGITKTIGDTWGTISNILGPAAPFVLGILGLTTLLGLNGPIVMAIGGLVVALGKATLSQLGGGASGALGLGEGAGLGGIIGAVVGSPALVLGAVAVAGKVVGDAANNLFHLWPTVNLTPRTPGPTPFTYGPKASGDLWKTNGWSGMFGPNGPDTNQSVTPPPGGAFGLATILQNTFRRFGDDYLATGSDLWTQTQQTNVGTSAINSTASGIVDNTATLGNGTLGQIKTNTDPLAGINGSNGLPVANDNFGSTAKNTGALPDIKSSTSGLSFNGPGLRVLTAGGDTINAEGPTGGTGHAIGTVGSGTNFNYLAGIATSNALIRDRVWYSSQGAAYYLYKLAVKAGAISGSAQKNTGHAPGATVHVTNRITIDRDAMRHLLRGDDVTSSLNAIPD